MNREKTKVVGRRGEVSWRFDLELAPPTDDSTNEFSFVELEKERARKVRVTGMLMGQRRVVYISSMRVCSV